MKEVFHADQEKLPEILSRLLATGLLEIDFLFSEHYSGRNIFLVRFHHSVHLADSFEHVTREVERLIQERVLHHEARY